MSRSASPRYYLRLCALLLQRLILAVRLVFAVIRLPAQALPAASQLSAADASSLLFDALLRPQRAARLAAARGSVSVPRPVRRSGGGNSLGSGAEEEASVSDSSQRDGGGGRTSDGGGRSSDDAGRATSDDAGIGSDDSVQLFKPRQSPARSVAWMPRLSPLPPTPGVQPLPPTPARDASLLAVDIGGTRTKFLLIENGTCTRLPPAPTVRIWQNPELDGPDRFEPATAPRRMRAYLRECGVPMERIGRLAFSVPGTVDLAQRSSSSVVKNTPSMSPKFRGFDFKEAFRDVCPAAKVSAVADNLAAALGVACQNTHLKSALVVVLGTAPAVASVFRDPSGKGKYIETAIWQSWVWFTKIKLDDPHGYCGGLKVTRSGITLKPPTSAKIPHHQARIRFALDDATWQRLRGCCEGLPADLQASLSEEEATRVWCQRLQSAVNALAERFHSIYGPPEEVHVLGGNATRCHGRVTCARYSIPDSTYELVGKVPVHIPTDDATQQLLHMSGLVYASCFKLKQVTAPGQDPLARGWTRGGEIYMWVAKGVKTEHELNSPAVAAVRAAAAEGGGLAVRDAVRREATESDLASERNDGTGDEFEAALD